MRHVTTLYHNRKPLRTDVKEEDRMDVVDGLVTPAVCVSGTVSTVPLVGAAAMGLISEDIKLPSEILRETTSPPRGQRKAQK